MFGLVWEETQGIKGEYFLLIRDFLVSYVEPLSHHPVRQADYHVSYTEPIPPDPFSILLISSKHDIADILRSEFLVPVDETKHDDHFDQEQLEGQLDESVPVARKEVPDQDLSDSSDHENDFGNEDRTYAKEEGKHFYG